MMLKSTINPVRDGASPQSPHGNGPRQVNSCLWCFEPCDERRSCLLQESEGGGAVQAKSHLVQVRGFQSVATSLRNIPLCSRRMRKRAASRTLRLSEFLVDVPMERSDWFARSAISLARCSRQRFYAMKIMNKDKLLVQKDE